VLEVIHAFEAVTELKLPYEIGPRRAGDVVKTWADTSKINQVLGWQATHTLEDCMRDSWRWQLALDNN
jgi:UDP-glucose 4-epimerase